MLGRPTPQELVVTYAVEVSRSERRRRVGLRRNGYVADVVL